MKRIITVKQALDLYYGVDEMGEAEISAEGLTNIDIAMNKNMMLNIVTAVERLKNKPKEFGKFETEINALNIEMDEWKTTRDRNHEFSKRYEELRTKYEKYINMVEENGEQLKSILFEKKTFDFIPIDKSKLKFGSSGRASKVMAHIMPMLNLTDEEWNRINPFEPENKTA